MASFPQVVAIFFATFDPRKGADILVQSPDEAITPSSPSSLFDFNSVSEYIIPKQELCNRLINICTPTGYRILGYPVLILGQQYERNFLIYNLAFVFAETGEIGSYVPVVRRLAFTFKQLEVRNSSRILTVSLIFVLQEQSSFLSKTTTRPLLHNVIEHILEDLNCYCECMCPINEANTINVKLFPVFRAPPPVKAYHVPICTVQLESLMDMNWDMTLQRIIPFIDGLKSVRKISALADVDFTLTKRCMEHLRSYGCLSLVDIFQFNNVYALTADIEDIVASPDLQNECVRYVSTAGCVKRPSFATLFELYCSLRQGKMLRDWVTENKSSLGGIDVRRFISFGVIKGFLYRVHRHPMLGETTNGDKKTSKRPLLRRHLGGRKHMDALCTMLECSVKDVEDQLAEIENIQWILR